MTREEAIAELSYIADEMPSMECADWKEAICIAIKALEQEPCEDCISRQAVIDGINEYFHDEYYQRTSIQDCRDCLIEDVIKSLPSVTPQQRAGRWIDAEVLDNIRAEIETDLSHFCFDEWGNENPTWKEIKAIIGKYKAESEDKE